LHSLFCAVRGRVGMATCSISCRLPSSVTCSFLLSSFLTAASVTCGVLSHKHKHTHTETTPPARALAIAIRSQGMVRLHTLLADILSLPPFAAALLSPHPPAAPLWLPCCWKAGSVGGGEQGPTGLCATMRPRDCCSRWRGGRTCANWLRVSAPAPYGGGGALRMDQPSVTACLLHFWDRLRGSWI